MLSRVKRRKMQKKEYKKMYRLEDKHFWFLGKRYFVDSLLKPYTHRIKNILDVGCGTGGMTKHLEKYGKVIGVEKEEYALDFCRRRKAEALLGNAQKLPFSDRTFDLVTLLDVLYHKGVQDEKRAVREAARVLKSKGLLLITDSAFEFLKSGHDNALHGKRRFTLTELETLVKKENFDILRASYIYFVSFLPVTLKRLLIDRLFGRSGSDVAVLPKTLNSLLLFLVRIEARLLRHISFPFGLSVAIVAQKNEK